MRTTLIFIFACISLFHRYSYAQTTVIPDSIFEQKLIQLGIDSDGLVNGQILNSDASIVTILDVSNTGISNLTGIEAFVNLTVLICKENHNLTSLNVTNNTALSQLYCDHANLTSLDVTNNIALTTLECSYNNIMTLDVTNNTALLNLYCSSNTLSSIDVTNNLLLRELYCNENNLTNLDISNNLSLTTLNCNSNNLTGIDLTGNTALVSLTCTDNNLTNLDVINNVLLHVLTCTDNNLGRLDITNNIHLNYFDCQNNQLNLGICVWDVPYANAHSNWHKSASAVYLDHCNSLAIKGRVAIDDNLNCLVDSIEQCPIGQLLKFERLNDNTVSYSSTYNSQGDYRAYLDTGDYLITIIPNNAYWMACIPSRQVTVDSNYVVQTIDWSLQAAVFCPYLEVDISAPFLRMTGGGSAYTVSYCNTGTVPAYNAYVEVDLDPDLTILNTALPIANQSGTVYTFNLGTIGVGDCGSFTIQVLVDSSALLSQTHCTEAHIYPDSICDPMWEGAELGGSVDCENDTVWFLIENRGSAMFQSHPYTIFEDNIAMLAGAVQLGSGQSTIVAQAAAEGHTYRIEVSQQMGYPAVWGDSIFSRVIEGCNPYIDGSFNTGFVTQFYNGYSAPFLAIDCQQNIASYDPNDKSAQPKGYGVDHYIEQNIPIDYKIRFQNTGTDTAFNIVIVDTLSSLLDISSLVMGASSHGYNWTIENNRVLKVSFPDILLVDSNANEPLSHGFFRYRIQQKNNNPIGAVIENQAAIYFDYNPAILTNTTFHTVGEDFITTLTMSVNKVYDRTIEVAAFPNPFTESTTIKIMGKDYDQLELSVFDISGRKMATDHHVFNNQIQLNKGNLQTGIYIYEIKGNGGLLNTGKIIVQ